MSVGLKCDFDSQFHPIQHLYRCQQCSMQSCSDCTTKQVAGIYCPNCLFEVASGSVRSEHGHCGRACLKCPACLSTLTICNINEKVVVSCGHCRWDSRIPNLTFEKPTAIPKQIKSMLYRPDEMEFNRLKEYYSKLVQYQKDSKFKPNFESVAASKEFQPIELLTDTGDVPSLELLVAQTCWGLRSSRDESMVPVRFKLKSKIVKLCPGCANVLIKPDPKIGSTQFLVDQSAWDSVPRIKVKQWVNESILLEIVNPFSDCIKFILQSSDTLRLKEQTETELLPFEDNFEKYGGYKKEFRVIPNTLLRTHRFTLRFIVGGVERLVEYELNN